MAYFGNLVFQHLHVVKFKHPAGGLFSVTPVHVYGKDVRAYFFPFPPLALPAPPLADGHYRDDRGNTDNNSQGG